MFTLSPDTHLCLISETAIFLDVPGNRYVRLTRQQTEWLSRLLAELPPPGTEVSRFAERLVARGLLLSRQDGADAVRPTCRSLPVSSVYDLNSLQTASGGARLRFVQALLTGWMIGRRKTLLSAVSAARQWKARAAVHGEPQSDEILASVNRFHALQPYFFTAHEACLFRSLVLARYLTLMGVRPDWVFAVRLAPFEAHCWIEHDGVLLNERTDKAREYRAILAV